MKKNFLNGRRLNNLFVFLLIFTTAASVSADDLSDGLTIKNGNLVDTKSKRVIQARRTNEKIKVDGNLNESAWADLEFQTNFIQRDPEEGSPATEKTEVGIIFDNDNIYFGVKCWDSEPDKIIAREMRRDARVDDDDNFELVLDTYHDQRSAFYFITNPNGVRRDAMLGNEGKQFNSSWDGVWNCRTRITEEGWFAELAIPWKTLRFASADSSIWGVNFARKIRRKNEHVFWELIPRDFGFSGLFRVSEAGDIYGLNDLEMGGNLELKPYFMGGIQNDENTDFTTDDIKDIGIDAKVAITANLSLDLTVNTDFAQVEADQERVNLTRFSLYFPEKRSFFLEGAEVFSFGGSGGMRMHRGGGSDMNLFYSRRIGIADGYEARIIGGVKIVGKIGQFQVGVLNMTTDDVNVLNEEDTVSCPQNNYSVIRMARDIGSRGQLGFMLLNKEEIASDGYNRAFGVDTYLPLNRYLSVNGYLAGTLDDEDKKGDLNNNLAAKLGINYDTDLWRLSLAGTDIGGGFNPELGYVRRVNFRYTDASISFNPRPANQDVIRQFWFRLSGNYRTDHGNRMLDNEISASMSINFQNSARATIGIQKEMEYLDSEWEVREGFLIPEGTYAGTDYYANFNTDQSRNVSGRFDIRYGSYYTGTTTRVGLRSEITTSNKLRTELDYSYNYVDLPQGNFSTNTFGLRVFYYFSTELYLKAYMQLNDDKLSYDGQQRVVSNIMLRWIYSPGSNIYLVYNDTRMIGADATEIQNRTAMIKATFFWRK